MANLTSSRGPHVRDLFVGSLQGDMVTFENKESRRMFSIPSSKNKRAPPPPKLGQYRPKILQGDEAEVPVKAREATPPERPVNNHNRVNAIIIGDKDVPVTLAPIGSDSDVDDDVETSRPHRGSPVPLSNGLSHFPHYTDSRSTEALVTGDLGQSPAQGHTNPGFLDNSSQEPHSPTLTDAPVAPPRYKKRTASSRRVLSPRRQELEEIDGVLVPAPDYDEHERTLEFEAEASVNGGHAPAVREFQGEDLGKYLPDDSEDGMLDTRSLRPRTPQLRKPLDLDKRAHTEARRFKKRGSDKKKGSLRHFSFADSKLASLDEGGERRRPKSADMTFSDMRDDTDVFLESKGESYESYLHSRHGTLDRTRSNSSGDGSLPDTRHAGKKDNVWKKLTVRLKRHVSGYSLPS